MIIYQQLEGFDEHIYYFCATIPTDIRLNQANELYWTGENQKEATHMSYDKTGQKDLRKVLQYD